MFSQVIESVLSRTEEIGRFDPSGRSRTGRLLEKSARGERLSPDEIVELMNSSRDEKNRALILDFSARYRRPRSGDILLLPPLYFSSICENTCLYCDFSRHRGDCLSPEEFLEEFEALLDSGYRSIELVSSQDPDLYVRQGLPESPDQEYDIERVLEYFAAARRMLDERGGGMLTSNIPPLDRKSFRRLKSAGLDCYLSWLETFHPGQYRLLHPQPGPKSTQAFRLDAFERAVGAGIGRLAGAFLKGLYDWRKEEAVLYCLDTYLKRETGRGFSIIGTPRLKGNFCREPFIRPYVVSDRDYELNIALDRILFDGVLWLQTREDYLFNKRLIDRYGAGVILTIDCSTAPGGYRNRPKARAQFPVHRRRLAETVAGLEGDGYRVIFDWDGDTLDDFQRRN